MNRAARLHVVAAILRDAQGRVLLTQRAPHRHQGGLWEFPGGKVEPGEAPAAALAREIDEELGIRVDACTPLHRVPWDYGDSAIVLDAHDVTAWQGTPEPRDVHALAWVEPLRLHDWPMPAADVPLAVALRLPRSYAITPFDVAADTRTLLPSIVRTIAAGVGMIGLRLRRAAVADAASLTAHRAAVAAAHEAGALVLVSDDAELAVASGADGVHLPVRRLRALSTRPLPRPLLVAASCHDDAELAAALALDCDFATLSPVLATASHPDGVPLGWSRFATLAAASPLPVFALGGVTPDHLAPARAHHAFGVAGIGAFWRA